MTQALYEVTEMVYDEGMTPEGLQEQLGIQMQAAMAAAVDEEDDDDEDYDDEDWDDED